MLTDGILLKGFEINKSKSIVKKNLNLIISEKSEVILSLKKSYKSSYQKGILKKFRNFSNYRIIGMGGSILGTETIYNFLKNKIKKNFAFINNIQNTKKKDKKKNL